MTTTVRAGSIILVAASAALAVAGCAGARVAPVSVSPPPVPAPPVTIESSAASRRRVAADAPSDDFADPDRARHVADLLPSLEKIGADAFEENKWPSLAIAIVVDGRPVLEKAFGFQDVAARTPATPATIYRVGSVTKTLTALALVRLRDEGRVDLDAPAMRWLPELGSLEVLHADAAPVTLRSLLTHTAGLARIGDTYDGASTDHDVTEAELLASTRARAAFDPGTKVEYSNLGFSLLGAVVGRASGRTYREYVQHELLAPLGMTSSGFDPAALPHDRLAVAYARGSSGVYEAVPYWRLGALEAAGGLFSSLDDLARYAAFELSAWPPRDDADRGPVQRASVREMQTTSFADGFRAEVRDGAVRATTEGVGLAWQTRETCNYERVVWHDGAVDGESSAVYLAPFRGFAVVLAANARDADLDALAASMLDRIAASKALEPRQPKPRKALVDLVSSLVSSLGDVSEALYERTFTGDMKKSFSLATIRQLGAKKRALHGACAVSGVEKGATGDSATFRASCDKGRLMVEVSMVEEGDTARLDGLRFTSEGFAPPRAVTEAATRILGLADHWDDHAAAKLGDSVVRARPVLASARATLGRCKLAPTDASDGQLRATLPLDCERGRAKLLVSLKEGGAEVRGFQLQERSDEGERCR